MRDREAVEALLGTPLEAAWPLRFHTWSPDGDLDYTVTYSSVELPRDASAELMTRAGFTTPDAAGFATVLLPSAWSVEPADPPHWWPPDPTALRDQVARTLDPNGWVVCGYGEGRLWLLATATPGPAPKDPEIA